MSEFIAHYKHDISILVKLGQDFGDILHGSGFPRGIRLNNPPSPCDYFVTDFCLDYFIPPVRDEEYWVVESPANFFSPLWDSMLKVSIPADSVRKLRYFR